MRSTVKYLFDRIFGAIGLAIAAPFMLFISIAIRLGSGSPVLYKQKRAGKEGRIFVIYKFRTMHPNDGANTISVRNDPRITKEGKFLRKWKLDELPELYNVLIGDMSFVGPRPDVPGYAENLSPAERSILSLRPGITGPATLKYLDEETILAGVPDPQEYNDRVIFPDKVRINLRYLEQYSLLEDLKIIIYTLIRKKIEEY
jgi:lipopolysaccharide/colanic/teichoic acid biosynthesis glycosyltransferase